jgi:hypothetical protein
MIGVRISMVVIFSLYIFLNNVFIVIQLYKYI